MGTKKEGLQRGPYKELRPLLAFPPPLFVRWGIQTGTSASPSSMPLCLIDPGLWSSCRKMGKCGPREDLCGSRAAKESPGNANCWTKTCF